MAEPLSIATSVVTLLATTKPIIKHLKALQEAPQELRDLLSEITQYDSLLQVIREKSWSSDHIHHDIKGLLKDATRKLQDIDSLVQYTLTKPGTSDKVDRLQWSNKKSEIGKLRKSLKDICADIVSMMGVETW